MYQNLCKSKISTQKDFINDTASPTDMIHMQLTGGNPTRLKVLQATIKRMSCACYSLESISKLTLTSLTSLNKGISRMAIFL